MSRATRQWLERIAARVDSLLLRPAVLLTLAAALVLAIQHIAAH